MNKAGKLRVAMIIQTYLPRLGGAEKQLAAVCRRLRARDIETVIITRRYPSLSAFEIIEQTPVYRVPAPQPKALAAFCFILFGLMRIRRIDADILHAHELLSPGDLGILAKKIWKKPLVVKVLRGGKLGDLDKLHNRQGGELRIRRLRTNVDRFIVISREIERELEDEGIPKHQCQYIPNGVDVELYAPVNEAEKTRLRRTLKLPQGFLCVYGGRLAPEKGLDLLLQAWKAIAEQDPGAHLLILGSGEMECKLRELAGKQVIFGGFAAETRQYYQAADAFVLPSLTEGLSNAMLEAMSCGLATAATRVGAAADLIDSGKNGLLIPPGNEEQIQKAIMFLIGHPADRARMGAAARERICRDYALDGTAEKLAGLYRELTGKGAN